MEFDIPREIRSAPPARKRMLRLIGLPLNAGIAEIPGKRLGALVRTEAVGLALFERASSPPLRL